MKPNLVLSDPRQEASVEFADDLPRPNIRYKPNLASHKVFDFIIKLLSEET
jgi:hypothetical protein